MPEQPSDALTPATRLLEKKREMAAVEASLAAKKEDFQLKMETLQQRRDDLERKERSLKEQLLKFEKFLKVRESLVVEWRLQVAFRPCFVGERFEESAGAEEDGARERRLSGEGRRDREAESRHSGAGGDCSVPEDSH